ncbi:MAG TPA: hypothetical protein VMR51_01980 [Patescibacteria group bacterium]|nr:hypothetical protein [Patescibacteria group bacterium]
MGQNKSQPQKGFGVVELVLIIVAVAAVVAVGYWVFEQRNKTATTNEAAVATVTNQPGQSIVNSIDSEATSEGSIDGTTSNSESAQAAVSQSTVTQVGDSANAASF